MISGFLSELAALVGLLLLILMPCTLGVNASGQPRAVLNKLAASIDVPAPDFVLLNQDNQRFDSKRLRGKVVVLDFIFTTCTDVCPIFTANFAQLQRKLNDRYRSDLFFVSVTTDPEVDSVKVLKAYAQRYGADFNNWAFLTGSEAQLKELWNGFSVRVIRKGRGLVQHTSLTTVIDRGGIRRKNYYGEKWPLKDLERDLLTLLDKKV